MNPQPGTVYLLGAGPGDPELITVKAVRILEAADVVVHDRLVHSDLLKHASPKSAIINVGKSPAHQRFTQAEINTLLVELARKGQIVARLKGGDPFVFGRGCEERLACEEAGVDCIVVPGVSSAIAGPAVLGIPVTHRHVSRSFAVVTARTDPSDGGEHLDYSALAAMDTVVVLMGHSVLGIVAENLIRAGRDPKTPTACIERATTEDQRYVVATLATIGMAVDRADLQPPVVTIISETVRLADLIA